LRLANSIIVSNCCASYTTPEGNARLYAGCSETKPGKNSGNHASQPTCPQGD
jgi:hypothetical protein